MPSVFAERDDGTMKVVTRYGNTPEEIANALIEEWGVSGYATPIPPGALWFATPR